jgi:hypothetical protein
MKGRGYEALNPRCAIQPSNFFDVERKRKAQMFRTTVLTAGGGLGGSPIQPAGPAASKTSYIAYEKQASTSVVGLPIAGISAPKSPMQAIQD